MRPTGLEHRPGACDLCLDPGDTPRTLYDAYPYYDVRLCVACKAMPDAVIREAIHLVAVLDRRGRNLRRR